MDAFIFLNMNCTMEYAILYEVVSCVSHLFVFLIYNTSTYIVQHSKHYKLFES